MNDIFMSNKDVGLNLEEVKWSDIRDDVYKKLIQNSLKSTIMLICIINARYLK